MLEDCCCLSVYHISHLFNSPMYINLLLFSPDLTNYEESNLFALRTCNAFWNGPVYIREPKDIEPMLEGMASQLTEREDFIITEDLRGFVSQ